MLDTSKIVLPYEPGYTGHREAERRQEETRRWLEEREKMIESPSVVPNQTTNSQKEPA